MIKFFRHIRKSMIKENRTTKYLLYAIGEIALVVIGILIALNINNSNETSKLEQKELILLTEMQQNLKQDLEELNENIIANKERIRSNEVVKFALETHSPFHDSLKYHFGNTYGSFQLIENTAAWENLKSIGLDLISNDSLRNSLAQLYSTTYPYIENVERNTDAKYQWDQLYPQILKHINIDTMWVSGTPENYEELILDREFLEVIKLNLFLRSFMQNLYSDAKINVIALLDQIESHILYLKK